MQTCSVPLLVQTWLPSGHTTREEYAAISQLEQLNLQKFLILPQQERHSGHSRLSKPSASLFFSGAVHYSSLTMQIHSDSSNICSCFKQGNRKTHLSKKQEYRLIIRINFSRQTSFPPISQLCSCHYSYGSKCHFTK